MARGTSATSRGPGGSPRAQAARVPARGTARSGYPADVAADVALYEGDVEAALRHYTAEVARARREDDPIRLVWTLYYVAICHAVRRTPELGLPAAQECMRVAGSTANPTAESMARYTLGLVLKKADPARALELFDEAAELAASVHNFWWQGIAHDGGRRDPRRPRRPGRRRRRVRRGPRPLGPGRGPDAAVAQPALRRPAARPARRRRGRRRRCTTACAAAGKPSPLDAAHPGPLADDGAGERFAAAQARGSVLSATEAVSLARAALTAVG